MAKTENNEKHPDTSQKGLLTLTLAKSLGEQPGVQGPVKHRRVETTRAPGKFYFRGQVWQQRKRDSSLPKDSILICSMPTHWIKSARYYKKQAVPQVIRPYAMQGFIDNNQHLQLHPKSNWQPVQFVKQGCYMGILRHAHHCLCSWVLEQLKFPSCPQGQTQIQHTLQQSSHKETRSE